MPDDLYVKSAREAIPLVDVDRKFIWWALLILAIGTAIKKTPASWVPWLRWHDYQEGWPVYLACELVIIFGTLALLRRKVRLFTNVRAFLFVVVLQVLVSIVWEATFAVPLGWWNYQMRAMVGVTISPWSNLPIEACFLWVSVGWGVMVMYETAKIKAVTGYSWRRVLRG
jgi:hypothetical protein